MGRQTTTILLLLTALALVLASPVSSDVVKYDSRDQSDTGDQTDLSTWQKDVLRVDQTGAVEAFVAKLETFARSVFTVVKAVVGAIQTVVTAIVKVLVKAVVKVAVVVGQWLIQFLVG